MTLWDVLSECNYIDETELTYTNEYTLLISIILSAQAQDKVVNQYTPALFSIADSAEKMLQLGTQIEYYINKIGLWRAKGANILAASKQIAELKLKLADSSIREWYDFFFDQNPDEEDMCLYGEIISSDGIPSFRLGLMQLRGVGRKTANVFLNTVYKAPVIAVDTHVQRVAKRLGIADGTPAEIERELEFQCPAKYKLSCSNWLVQHGRIVCTAKNPKCTTCPIRNFCATWHKQNG